MTENLVDRDPAIKFLRNSIDLIDEERAARVANWIIATVFKIDQLESGQMNRNETLRHWRPYSDINLLTRQRDRRSIMVGERKKELEEKDPYSGSTHQEGRWQEVKLIYMQAVREECDEYEFNDEARHTALEWMHHYTEYEHERSKGYQDAIRGVSVSEPEFLAEPLEIVKPRFRLPRLLLHLPDHRQSA